ncbi:MAG TPA: CBS domain-containing protein [Blastocatellia bacterium]|nr:CBS domain-containing protein [Blastocatellia bacterium]
MKVRDAMTAVPTICGAKTNLATAIELMWNGDCGILPVVDGANKVIGVITDRDIAVATGTRSLLASEIVTADVMTGEVFACLPDDDIHEALEVMRKHKVRRLPIVNFQGEIAGLLSLDDIATHAEPNGNLKPELSFADLGATFRAICGRELELREQLAVAEAAA